MEDIDKHINNLIKHCKSKSCKDCEFVKVGCWRNRVVSAVWSDKRSNDIDYVKTLLTMYEIIKEAR